MFTPAPYIQLDFRSNWYGYAYVMATPTGVINHGLNMANAEHKAAYNAVLEWRLAVLAAYTPPKGSNRHSRRHGARVAILAAYNKYLEGGGIGPRQ